MVRRRSIRLQLLLSLNGAIAALLCVFLAIDYEREIGVRLAEKHVALQEEAKTLLPAIQGVRPRGEQAVQQYVDAVCGAMRDSQSPGHHIAVRFGDGALQALAHDRASPEILAAMQHAARLPSHRATLDGEELVVGTASQGDLTVYVSEYLATLRRSVQGQAFQRLWRIAVLVAVTAGVVNVVFLRMAAGPLRQLVATVRRIGEGELGARAGPFRAAEFAYLADAVNAMSASLAEADRRRRLEMARARRIQEQLLPTDTEAPGLKLAYSYHPAEDVAGDYYDRLRLEGKASLLCIADVAGHGVPAAMSAAMLKALLLHAIERSQDPGEMLEFINRQWAGMCQGENLASMLLARFDPATRVIAHASAGHEPGWLVSAPGKARELASTGLMLGVVDEGQWSTEAAEVAPGDRLLLVTDGVTEAFSPAGELFGRSRLLELFLACREVPLSESVRRIDNAVDEHCGGRLAADDATIVAAEFLSREG